MQKRYDNGGKYKVEVIADSSGKFAGNGLTFDTLDDAEEYARDLFSRWTLVTDWRIVETATGNVAKSTIR